MFQDLKIKTKQKLNLNSNIKLMPYIAGMAVFVLFISVFFWYFQDSSRQFSNKQILSAKWLESGGINSVMAKLPDEKIMSKEFNEPSEEIAARKIGEEIISLRKANTEVFKVNDLGELNAKIYTDNKYYFDEKASIYKEIDVSVHEVSDLAKTNTSRKFDEYVDAGVYKATWFKDKPWNYKFYVGDSWIEYEALFEESDALEINIEKLKTGLKETITLKDNTAPTKLSWRIKEFLGESVIITPPPIAWDAEGNNVPVTESKSGDILTYEVDTANAIFPVMVDPTTSITATNDGTIYTDLSSPNWPGARDAADGSGVLSNMLKIGSWYYAAPNNMASVYRGFASFQIPSVAEVSSCSFNFYSSGIEGSNSLYVYTSTYSSLRAADFELFDGRQVASPHTGTILNNAWSTSSNYSVGWNQVGCNAAGLSAVLAKSNDTFKIVLITGNDKDNSPPNNSNQIIFFANSSTAGREPYLSLTYEAPVSAPTLTTQSASSNTATSTVLNGTVSDAGGLEITTRGFKYGLTETDTWDVHEDGSFSTGSFSLPITELTKGTTYYVRSYATNSMGTSYGSYIPFTTTLISDPIIINKDVIFRSDVILK